MKFADQGQSSAVPMTGPGHLVGAIGRVAHEHESAIGGPAEHQPEQPDHVLGRRPVPTPSATVVLLGLIEGDQDGQRPGPVGEGEADEDGEHDPLVAVLPGGEGVRGTDRIAVPGLAVDVGPGVPEDGVVADEDDREVLREQGEDPSCQGAR